MQYIYTMNGVSKIVPPKRQIIKDISLSFFPGAKIGLLGLNGAGKSTVLKIMAGVDKDFQGEARPQPGIKIGYLAQEPQLDPGEDRARSGRGRRVGDPRCAEAPGRGLRRLCRGRRRLRQAGRRNSRSWKTSWRRTTPTHSSASSKWPPTRCACRRGTPRSARCPVARSAAWRCAGCCCPSPTCCCWTSRPTIWTPNRSTGWSSSCSDYPGTVVAVTHDRYFLDNAAEWILELDRGRGIPWKGNYTDWLEQKERAPEHGRSRRKGAARRRSSSELEWVRSAAKGRQAKGKARLARFEELNSVEYQKRNETNETLHPAGRAPGPGSDRVQERHRSRSATAC